MLLTPGIHNMVNIKLRIELIDPYNVHNVINQFIWALVYIITVWNGVNSS